MSDRTGKVYIVGAGLGDVAYLTIKAKQLLAQAEVLIYDALVDTQLLQLVPENCLKLNVGKRGGKPSTPQTEIDQLLVKYCQQGQQVVRLKSGDPFIFGRSSSEIQALIAAKCVFEIIPGLSSALAAPLLAGIPLTDPLLSRCFTILTAHDPNLLDWEMLARMETLVILMGGQNLGEIIRRLDQYGRSLQTPVAIIRSGGTPQQQVWTGNLANILEQTAGISLSPAVIVIGEVVTLRNSLQSPDKVKNYSQTNLATVTNTQNLLIGKTILVTRSLGQSSELCDRLQQQGAKVIEMPALEIGPPSSWQELDNAIAHLTDFDWLILTSTNGVEYFFGRLTALKKDARALAGVKIAVVGEKTALSLKQHGLTADFIPPNFIADSLVENFPEQLEAKKILFPRVETGGREVLVKELTAKGAEVIEVAAYESRCPSEISPIALDALKNGTVDIITFASSKTVQYFCQLIGNSLSEDWLKGICIASIGPQTSKACHQLLGKLDVEAEEYTVEGLVTAICKGVFREF